MIQISAIIPSYNSHQTVMRTLESLLAQPATYVSEIIVVDSSDDGVTLPILQSCRSPRVKLTHLDKKTIPAVGRNLGAMQAAGDLFAFVDSDVAVADDWAEKIILVHEGGCRVGGGVVLLPDFQKNKKIALAQYFLQFSEFMAAKKQRVVDFAPSCNLFCERALFEKLGGFPEIRACEDVLFGQRVGRETPFFLDPEIRAYHIFREDRKSYLDNQKMLGRYILIYRRDYLKQGQMRGVMPLLLLPAIFIVKLFRVVQRVYKNGGFSALSSLLSCFPLFISGLCAWTTGFAQGCLDRKQDSV